MKELTPGQTDLMIRSMEPWLEADLDERRRMVRSHVELLNGPERGVFGGLPGDWSPRQTKEQVKKVYNEDDGE